MELKYWLGRWDAGDFGFHATEVEPLLVKYFSALHPGKVFVPLCGKSNDMMWFIQKGWQVLGAEGSPIACRAFFEENGLSYETREQSGFTVYSSNQVTLWCGDFFTMPTESFTDVTAAYDRAALIALPPELRKKYVGHMETLLTSSTSKRLPMLLIALEYTPGKVQGPPFSVDFAEIQNLYGNWRTIRELLREEDTFLPKNNPKFNDVRVFEAAYLLE